MSGTADMAQPSSGASYNSKKASDGMSATSPDQELSTLARNSLSLEERLGKDEGQNEPTEARSGQTSSVRNETAQRGTADPPAKGPLVPAQPIETETEKVTHDTTIHRTVKPPVIHETIRPVETNIITTNVTVHRHVHHYVHRIQPILVTSDEEERLVHDIMGEGRAPTTNMTYRQLGTGGSMHQTHTGEGSTHQTNTAGVHGKVCKVCGGATGNVLYREKGGDSVERSAENTVEQDISGESCPICGRNTDELSQGMRDMKIRN